MEWGALTLLTMRPTGGHSPVPIGRTGRFSTPASRWVEFMRMPRQARLPSCVGSGRSSCTWTRGRASGRAGRRRELLHLHLTRQQRCNNLRAAWFSAPPRSEQRRAEGLAHVDKHLDRSRRRHPARDRYRHRERRNPKAVATLTCTGAREPLSSWRVSCPEKDATTVKEGCGRQASILARRNSPKPFPVPR